MRTSARGFEPPFCPNPNCRHHLEPSGWRWVRAGTYERRARPRRIQRFRCLDCARSFSTQTFDTTYWLKRPDLQPLIFRRQVECSCFRQTARSLGVSPTTVRRQVERLGRHCLLYLWKNRPQGPPREALVLDGFQSFEYSQFWPYDLNLVVGSFSPYHSAFTDAELRRSGSMTASQKRERERLEKIFGRPDPRATEKEVEAVLRLVVPEPAAVTVISDEHRAYPRALARMKGYRITHQTHSSKAARTPFNPLWPANHADLLIRHSGSHHKRETIAFSKRRQGSAERMAIHSVWRNDIKRISERDPRSPTPAMRLDLASAPRSFEDVLQERLFPSRVQPPERVMEYYRREVDTRQVPNGSRHELRYAF